MEGIVKFAISADHAAKAKIEGIVKFAKIDIESMIANSEKDPHILLKPLYKSNVEVIKAKHGMSHENFSNVLQVCVGDNAKLFKLDGKKTQEISYLEELDRFGGDPETYINTGYF